MRRVVVVALFEFLHVLAQFANFVIWGALFGARPEMDAFMTSSALPSVLVAVAVGPLIASLVPILVEIKIQSSAEELNRFRGNLVSWTAAAGILLALLFFFGSGVIVSLVAPGLSREMSRLAASLLSIGAFSIPLVVVNGVLVSLHFAEEKFSWPTLVPCLGSLTSLALVVFCHERLGIHVLAWGTVLAALSQTLLLVKVLRGSTWRLDLRNPGLRKLAHKMMPLSAGNLYYKSDPLVDRFLLSFLPAGSISYLGYAQRVVNSLTQVLARGLVTTRFTGISTDRFKGMAEFKQSVNRLFVQVFFFAAPVVLCLVLFTRPLLHYVLERGEFTTLDVQRTAYAVIALAGFLLAGLLGGVLTNAFYALGETRMVARIGVAAFTVGILLKAAGVRLFSYIGVAAATSFYYFLALALEAVVMQKRIGLFTGQKTGRCLLKILAASGGALAVGLICKVRLPGGFDWLLLKGAATVAAYFILCRVLGMTAADELPHPFAEQHSRDEGA